MIRVVIEMPGTSFKEARQHVEYAMQAYQPESLTHWYTRIKNFEKIRRGLNQVENDNTTISKLRVGIASLIDTVLAEQLTLIGFEEHQP